MRAIAKNAVAMPKVAKKPIISLVPHEKKSTPAKHQNPSYAPSENCPIERLAIVQDLVQPLKNCQEGAHLKEPMADGVELSLLTI